MCSSDLNWTTSLSRRTKPPAPSNPPSTPNALWWRTSHAWPRARKSNLSLIRWRCNNRSARGCVPAARGGLVPRGSPKRGSGGLVEYHMPRISGAAIDRTLERLDFVKIRQSGSRVIMPRGPRGCVVPMHDEVKVGTLAGISR